MPDDFAAPPPWKLPEGVNAPLWHYSRSQRLAEEEDAYFRDHPLFEADARILSERLNPPGPLIDLGCGAGRLSILFARKGFEVTAVDLSRPMLAKVAEKAGAEGLSVGTVRANLCRLDAFPAGHFAFALMMFSTLGMIRGRPARRKALAGAARLLRPDGLLALHAHNLWLNLHDPQGRRWLVGQAVGAILGRSGAGDRRMTYRGIPGMEVHLYRMPELRQDLRSAGLVLQEAIPLDAVTARTLPHPGLWPSIRAGGWIVFARKFGAVNDEGARGSLLPRAPRTI